MEKQKQELKKAEDAKKEVEAKNKKEKELQI